MRTRSLLLVAVVATLLAVTATAGAAPTTARGPACHVESADASCVPDAQPEAPSTDGHDTSSEADFPEVHVGANKVGYRAFVAFETGDPAWSTLDFRYTTGNGWSAWFQASEATPREKHVYVLRNLPTGETLQVRPSYTPADGYGIDADYVQGPEKVIELANAHEDYDAEADAYTVDFVLVVDESTPLAQDDVEEGVQRFAKLVRDSTDGYVRLGETLVLFGDTEAYHAGRAGCSTSPQASPVCSHVPDAVITTDESPQAAGSTRKGAIEEPRLAFRLNNQHFALGDPPHLLNTIGGVLLHEFGHYGFWMDDLYTGSGCGGSSSPYDISIMGETNGATEFDGPNAPCPNMNAYGDSWSYLQDHYPQVPARPDGPAPGPSDAGAAFDLTSYSLLPGESLADEPVVVRVDRGADCRRTGCAAASVAGPASGTVAASGTGTATSPLAVGAGDCRSSGDQAPRPCQDVRRDGEASGHYLGATADGDATCRTTPCVAAASGGAASGSAAAATGPASGLAAASTGGPASGLAAASGTGSASGLAAASGTGGSAGTIAATSGTGPATGVLAVSGTGDASGIVAVSGTGSADGLILAASATGDASGTYAVSGCDAADPAPTEPVCSDAGFGISLP